MALNPNEKASAEILCLSHQQVYNRVYKFYTQFTDSWQNMSDSDKKKNFPRLHIDQTSVQELIDKLPTETDDLFFVLELCNEILSGKLEFGYHLTDTDGLKMGQYHHYLVTQYRMLKPFLAV
ncbi:MAG: hypothetical protein FJX80_05225 [Bacteroidetes bacterium]|nr:hypothetical protein [Bacteroidota bacterium]